MFLGGWHTCSIFCARLCTVALVVINGEVCAVVCDCMHKVARKGTVPQFSKFQLDVLANGTFVFVDICLVSNAILSM